MKGNDYAVYIGDVLIGHARDVADDMPSTIGRFEATPEFETHRPLFDEVYRLLQEQKYDDRAKLMNKIILLGLRLESPRFGVLHGQPSSNVQPGGFVHLYIVGDRIWWRPC